jgi:hypothetical protein
VKQLIRNACLPCELLDDVIEMRQAGLEREKTIAEICRRRQPGPMEPDHFVWRHEFLRPAAEDFSREHVFKGTPHTVGLRRDVIVTTSY